MSVVFDNVNIMFFYSPSNCRVSSADIVPVLVTVLQASSSPFLRGFSVMVSLNLLFSSLVFARGPFL